MLIPDYCHKSRMSPTNLYVQKFLGLLSLSTGASLITLSLLLNKLSGFYGILALLTGYHLSPFQLSMYIYSIGALILTVYLLPHIKTQSPLHCVALAWFYVLDSIVNAAYTAAFAVTWFLVLLQHQAGKDAGAKGPGAGTINDTAGFTNPEHNVTQVDVIASPQAGNISPGSGQDAVAAAQPGSAPAGVGSGDIILGRESINSIGIIIALWTIRAYFCLVMLSWARMVLRQHIAVSSANNPNTDFTAANEKGQAENPFSESKPEGQGWRGKFGRFMISLGRSYWLGTDEDDSWMNDAPHRFRAVRNGSTHSGTSAYATNNGVVLGKIETGQNAERERRRRSGTGPPRPSVQLSTGFVSDGEDAGSETASRSSFMGVERQKL